MALSRYTIYPWLGTITAVPADDPSLIQGAGASGGISHDVGGQHFDIRKVRNATSKSDGYIQLTNTACATGGFCQGLFELYDGVERDMIMFYKGVAYRIDSVDGVYEPTRIIPSTLTLDDQVFSINCAQYGSYILFADGMHTPYKWCHLYGETPSVTFADKLIQQGTEYKFKYLEFFQGRIIGAYADGTNEDISIRWTDVLPNVATLEFDATNQLYKPGTDSIVGMKRMGGNALYVYGERTINRVDYYPDFTTPFAMVTLVEGQSMSNMASLISIPNRHFFFNRDYGFIEYAGGTDWAVISDDIEDKLHIRNEYANRIIGTFDPYHKELVWLWPGGTESTPNQMLRYDLRSKQWRISPWEVTYVDKWIVLTEGRTWTELSNLGGSNQTWTDIINKGYDRWMDVYQDQARLVFGGVDGFVYYEGGDSADNSSYDSYRIEPIMDFGDPQRKKLLLEIWFGFGKVGTYHVNVWWRGGDTAAECESHSWESLGYIRPCAATSAPCVYPARNERFHQIKWGTSGKEDQYEVNRIDFHFYPQGKY